MPCKDAAPSAKWISSSDELDRAVAGWADIIGLDTEFIRTDTFYPMAGLYQIASGNDVYLLDPLGIEEWSAFVDYLEDPHKTKVMHACQEDLELLNHHLGARPVSLFDTQFANAYLSRDFSLSYARLVEQRLGVELSKHETRSNWLKRPLSDEQIRYAMDDVVYLAPLHELLVSQLSELGRSDWFNADIPSRTTYVDIDPRNYYRNVKRAWQLDGHQLAVLSELAAWREDTARALDIPRNRVVWDEHLHAFSQISQLTVADVEQVLPRAIARRHGQGLVERHALGRTVDHPQPLDKPLNATQGAMLKSLRDVARKRADELGVAHELLARKRDLEFCIRCHLADGQLSDFYAGWRANYVADEFGQLLRSLG